METSDSSAKGAGSDSPGHHQRGRVALSDLQREDLPRPAAISGEVEEHHRRVDNTMGDNVLYGVPTHDRLLVLRNYGWLRVRSLGRVAYPGISNNRWIVCLVHCVEDSFAELRRAYGGQR